MIWIVLGVLSLVLGGTMLLAVALMTQMFHVAEQMATGTTPEPAATSFPASE